MDMSMFLFINAFQPKLQPLDGVRAKPCIAVATLAHADPHKGPKVFKYFTRLLAAKLVANGVLSASITPRPELFPLPDAPIDV
ncbi:hypothetical protein UBN61_07220 [Helicobacter pylori]